MSIKRILIVGTVAVIVLACIFGKDGLRGMVGGGKQAIKNVVNDNMPSGFDVGRIETLIKTEAGKIQAFESELSDLNSKITGERKKVVKFQQEKDNELKALAIANGLLQEEKEEYVIKDYAGDYDTYTFAQVQEDAMRRLEYVKALNNRIALSTTLISDLDITHKTCHANLLVAKKNLAAKANELEKLQAREMNAEIKEKAQVLSSSLRGLSDSLLSQSALEEAFRNYEKKVVKKEIGINGVEGIVESSSIPYDIASEDAVIPITEQISIALEK